MNVSKAAATGLLLALIVLPSAAQQPPPGNDPIAHLLYPPDTMMSHQSELSLSEQQRAIIRSEVGKAQAKFFDLQWQMTEETEKMAVLLRAAPIDETKVLAQADKVMGLEREIKRAHLSLLIRLKNMLSPQQIAKLDEIRRKSG